MTWGEGRTSGGLILRSMLALLLLAVLLAAGRAAVESHRYFGHGEASRAADDWESAVYHYRHGLQWYVPLLSRSGACFDALVDIGDARLRASDLDGALVAYRSARFGVMATRHLWTPLAGRLPDLHRRIAEGMVTQIESDDPASRSAEYRAELDAYESRRPNPWLGLLSSLGFYGWLACLGWVATRGFDREGTVRRRPFGVGLGMSLLCLALWLVALRWA